MMISDDDLKTILKTSVAAELRRIERMRFATTRYIDDVVCFEKQADSSEAPATVAA